MNRKVTFILVLLVAVIGVGSATAQTDSKSITVSAANSGSFVLTINQATYAFGAVDSNGTANTGGTESLTGTRAGTVATYTSGNVTTFSVLSAPVRTVRIFNASTASTINWGTADRLSVGIPTTGLTVRGGNALTSCGFKAFSATGDDASATGCTAGMLVKNFGAGNGGSQAAGFINFQLAVDDTDATGSNSWTVTLTATGA